MDVSSGPIFLTHTHTHTHTQNQKLLCIKRQNQQSEKATHGIGNHIKCSIKTTKCRKKMKDKNRDNEQGQQTESSNKYGRFLHVCVRKTGSELTSTVNPPLFAEED